MFVRILAYVVFTQSLLWGVCEPVFGQQLSPDFQSSVAGTIESARPSEITFVDIDIYLQGPDNASVEETAALTLLTAEGQLSRQGTARKGHLRWNNVVPMQYTIQVVAPGFERAVQEIHALGTGEVRVTVQLRPQAGQDKAYPPASSDPDVNYVFGVYASRLGDWEQAELYWTKVLQLVPKSVPALVSMGEALLSENKTSEAAGYLDRAAKIDPSYWRTQAVLAEVYLRKGSTGEAVQHAERAIELGDGEAASVSPLLARALAAEATEVLRAYLEDHPGDVAAKKQLEGLNTLTELRSTENLNADSGEKNPAIATDRTTSPRRDRWLPPDVDQSVPPVEPGLACNLAEVQQKAGQKIQEFVKDVERFTATESLLHESINKSGEVSGKEKRKYDYLVSIEEIRPGILDVEEYQSSGTIPVDSPGGILTKGLPALVLIFHPYYSESFSMKCEGLATLNGKQAWQIYFRQKEDKPNRIRAYRIGMNGPSYPVPLKGRAWFVADSYQIVGLQADLIHTLPDIRLMVDHTAIEYGPVHFSRGVDMWLPQTAEVYSDWRGKRIHQRMSFSNYLLFAVDDRQKISSPKTSP
jgi:tetratricopeptide (TPR) repeat protein